MRVQLEDGVLEIRPTVFRGGERYRLDEYGVRAHDPVVVEGYAFDHDDGSRALEGAPLRCISRFKEYRQHERPLPASQEVIITLLRRSTVPEEEL